VPVVHKLVEEKYPHQNRDYVKRHNLQVRNWLAEHYSSVLYLDFWNLTADGINVWILN
jgi:hypothetical protein